MSSVLHPKLPSECFKGLGVSEELWDVFVVNDSIWKSFHKLTNAFRSVCTCGQETGHSSTLVPDDLSGFCTWELSCPSHLSCAVPCILAFICPTAPGLLSCQLPSVLPVVFPESFRHGCLLQNLLLHRTPSPLPFSHFLWCARAEASDIHVCFTNASAFRAYWVNVLKSTLFYKEG